VVAGAIDLAEDGAGGGVEFHDPAGGAVGLIAGLAADPEGTVLQVEGEGFVAVSADFGEVLPFPGEALDAAVFAIGDVDDLILIDGDAVGEVQLAGALAWCAPLAETVAVGIIFEDAGVAVAIGDEEVAIGGEGDVGGAVELAFCFGLFADGEIEEDFTLGGEFEDAAAGGVDSPDVAFGIDADAVGDLVEALAPFAEDLALFVDGDDGLGGEAALEEIDGSFAVGGGGGDHAEFPVGAGRRDLDVGEFQREYCGE